MGPNMELKPQFPQKVQNFHFIFIKRLLAVWYFQNGLIDFHMTFQSVDVDLFPQFAILGTMCYVGSFLLQLVFVNVWDNG